MRPEKISKLDTLFRGKTIKSVKPLNVPNINEPGVELIFGDGSSVGFLDMSDPVNPKGARQANPYKPSPWYPGRDESVQESKRTMKKEFLELLIRECVSELLEVLPGTPEQDTVGAPAPPGGNQPSPGQPTQPVNPEQSVGPVLGADVRGVLYVDPKRPEKPIKLTVNAKDTATLERELYRTAARSGGPRVKVASATLREVPKTLANPNTALFLYIGKQNPDDDDSELYLLPAKTYQQAKAASVPPGVSAEHPTTQVQPDEPVPQMPQSSSQAASKTTAPNIDEGNDFRNMISSMIKESIKKHKR